MNIHNPKSLRINTAQARAADVTPNMRYVLAIGMSLAISTMSLAWIIPAIAR